MSKLALSFLFSVFSALPTQAFSATENDLAGLPEPATDTTNGADASQTALEPEPATEPASLEVSTEPTTEPSTESAKPVGEQEAAEASIEEAEPVTEQTPVNAAAAAGVTEQTGSAIVESTTESSSDNVVTTDPQKTEENRPVVLDGDVKETSKVESAQPEAASVKPLKTTQMEFFVGASLMNFGYTEFATDGSWLDEERGVLPGLLVGGSLHWSRAYVSLAMSYHFGNVDYQGQTQSANSDLSGLPISSTSDADIVDTTAIAGYQFSSVSVYGGFGYYFWRRNIRPTTTDSGLPVAGVLEFYSWTYALLGAKTELWRNWTSHIDLDLRVTRMLQANMEVDFLGFGGYDNASLNLGEDWGLRLAVPWTFHSFAKDSSITIEPYYISWNLKRSTVTELTVGGVGTGSGVVEPRSETRNFGISVYFSYLM